MNNLYLIHFSAHLTATFFSKSFFETDCVELCFYFFLFLEI